MAKKRGNETPETPSPSEASKNFSNSVESMGRAWQKLLNLGHWKIRFAVMREEEMANKGAIGECYHHETDKRATIVILDPQDWNPDNPFYRFSTEEVEKVIIHELMHVVLQDVAVKSPRRELERCNNHITDILYTLSKKDSSNASLP